jgi:hypothetical protein
MNKSLKTKDNLIYGSLFKINDNLLDEFEELNQKNKFHVPSSHELFLCGGDKIITEKLFSYECEEIINNALSYGLNSCSYDTKTRESNQLCIIDPKLSKYIFVLLQNIISQEYSNVTPCGLDNDNCTWELAGINKCIRINCYDAPSVGFKPHYDAPFCESEYVKSALSIIIYLNQSIRENIIKGRGNIEYYDDTNSFNGGKTIFFHKQNGIFTPGQTVNEEIKANGRLETYEKIVINPELGKCIIFPQNLLHSASRVKKGSKYVLRADVIYRKVTADQIIQRNLTIFDDIKYQLAANFFKEAQSKDLEEKLVESNDLYERNISVRKYYVNAHTKMYDILWLYVSSYFHLKEKLIFSSVNKKINAVMTCSKSIFWNDTYFCSNEYFSYFCDDMNDMASNDFGNPIHQKSKAYIQDAPCFVPKYVRKNGITNYFKYDRSVHDLFEKNAEAYLRVITILTIFLSNSSPDTQNYVAQYNPKSKTVLQCDLLWLLICAYYEKLCGGTFYNIKNNSFSFFDDEVVLEDSLNEELQTVIQEIKNTQIKNTEIKNIDNKDSKINYDSVSLSNYCARKKLPIKPKTRKTISKDHFIRNLDKDQKKIIDKYDLHIQKNNYERVNNQIVASSFSNYRHTNLNSNDINKLFDLRIDLDKSSMIGFQLYDSESYFRVEKHCDWIKRCETHWPPSLTHETKTHRIIKNNLIFNFAKQKIIITECENKHHHRDKFTKCYEAKISNLDIKPYFHASCQAIIKNYKIEKSIKSSFYKNRYLDKIHIKVTVANDKTIYIETIYSCIESF